MRTLISLLVVLVASAVAMAADLGATSSALATAMGDRVTELGKPAKGTPEKTEQKQLKKAGKSFRKFKGVLDRAGVLALLKTGKGIVKSGTTDTDTTDAAEAVLGCVLDALADQEDALLVDAEALFAPSDLDTLQEYLDDARAAVATAGDEGAATDEAFAAVKQAFLLYTKAAKFVRKTTRIQAAQLLPIGAPFSVLNRNGVKFTVQKVVFDLIFTPQGGGDPVRVFEDFRDHQDAESGYTLPYVLKDDLANFVMYPTMYAAVEAVVGPNPVGTVTGAIHFKSTKHGKADIPVDMSLFAP